MFHYLVSVAGMHASYAARRPATTAACWWGGGGTVTISVNVWVYNQNSGWLARIPVKIAASIGNCAGETDNAGLYAMDSGANGKIEFVVQTGATITVSVNFDDAANGHPANRGYSSKTITFTADQSGTYTETVILFGPF